MSKAQYKPLGFREFLIGDLLGDRFGSIKQVKSQGLIEDASFETGISFVIQSEFNNMTGRTVNKQSVLDNGGVIDKGNKLVLGVTLGCVSYHPEMFSGSQLITIDMDGFSENVILYFLAFFEKNIVVFNYRNKPGVKKYKALSITLPVLANNEPDYEYMDYFVEELKHKYVEELDAWWSQAGFASLPDTLLTNNDRNVIKKYQQAQFNQVPLSDMFNIINDKVKITDADFDKYPEVLAQTANNGVAHSKFGQPSLLKGLTIGMRGSFNTYMHDSPFIIGPNVAGLQLKQSTRDDEAIYLYVSANLNKQYARFSGYTNYPTFTKLKNEVEITVPMTNDDQPDYDLISQYMQVMKKLTIQTHRAWLDEQLAEYQSLI